MNKFLGYFGFFLMCLVPVWAQSEAKIRIDRDGDFHVRSPLTVGDKQLNRGMYRASRIAVNGTNYVVFRKVTMGSPWRSMGPAWVSTEIGRIRCIVRDREVVNRRSELISTRFADGQWRLAEVRFKNESSACVLQEQPLE